MNVFYTDRDIDVCAKNHCLVHMRKMIVEYCQMLSTAHWILDNDKLGTFEKTFGQLFYKPTHVNHPQNVWVRSSLGNYKYLFELTRKMVEIYPKDHKSRYVLRHLETPPVNICDSKFFEPPITAPNKTKSSIESLSITDPVEAYRLIVNDKYEECTTRTDKRPIKVEFIDGQVPNWVNKKVLELNKSLFTRGR